MIAPTIDSAAEIEKENMTELLAPAGNLKKLKTAIHFGADAVYFAGKQFGLRAYAGNFGETEIAEGIRYAHERNKKTYVTANIFPYNSDFSALRDYFRFLKEVGADAVLVSDLGAARLCLTEGLNLHVSTQANTTNRYAALEWAKFGAERVVLARECSLADLKETTAALFGIAETEVFVHGAMCMAYSGRCMLSTYLTGRDSNRGECVQACRWEYRVSEVSRPERPFYAEEDERGTYLFNSKDLSAMPILKEIVDTGVSSLKIEGRMKSEYYIATVTNAYRKAIDAIQGGNAVSEETEKELDKVNHRDYTTGFYLGNPEILPTTSKPANEYDFAAEVIGYDKEKGLLQVEQRNRFREGDRLEIVSPNTIGTVTANHIYDKDGNRVADAKRVQQRLFIETEIALTEMDVLRIKRG